MNQTEKRTLLEKILRATQKTRSNLFETIVDEEDRTIVDELFPYSMDTEHMLSVNDMPPLMWACLKMLEKEEIENIDIFNIVSLVKKDMSVELILAMDDVKLPEMRDIFTS